MCDWAVMEYTRCTKRLGELDPASEEYGRVLDHLIFSGLADRAEHEKETPEASKHETAPHVKEAVAEALELLPTEEAPKAEPIDAPESMAKTYSKEEVRAALAESRKRGVKVTDLLAEFGYDNFSAVPADEYGDIMKRLETT